MSEFINTRNGENDYEVLDGLVSDTIGEFNEDGINIIPRYKFSKTINLKKIHMPAVTIIKENAFDDSKIEECTFEALEKIESYGFSQCTELKSFYAPNLYNIGSYAFSSCKKLTSIDLTKITNLGNSSFTSSGLVSVIAPINIMQGTFRNCENLTSVDLSLTTYIGENSFMECKKLTIADFSNPDFTTLMGQAFYNTGITHCIIRKPSSIVSLSATSAFNNTPIKSGLGSIYVPNDLVETYKTATNWSYYADRIFPISEYPKTNFGTIADTWEEIFTAEENNTYETKYSIGDTKAVEIDGQYYMMQIIAFNSDIKADESDVAKITWLCKDTISSNSNTSMSGDLWTSTPLYNYLYNDIYNKINNTIKNKIIQVKKGSSNEYIWIPSSGEIKATDTSSALYGDFFDTSSKRIKRNRISNSVSDWWLRSTSNSTAYHYVTSTGDVGSKLRSSSGEFVFGFCT